MPDDGKLPVTTEDMDLASLVPMSGLPVALRIFFNPAMFERCKSIARYMSDAKGFVPAHIAGNPSACFAIVSRSLTWKLDPFAVAQATYEVGGKVGYYGSLCQAILENSGRIENGIRFDYFGDWARVQRKFKLVERTNQYNKLVKAPEQLWSDDDEEGLGVFVRAQIRDEAEPRELEFFLSQAWPRNSTLWITDPKTQIRYTAVRRFATSVAPTLFLGVPFDREQIEGWADSLKDVTLPRPRRSDFVEDTGSEQAEAATESLGDTAEEQPETAFYLIDADGVEHPFDHPAEAAVAMDDLMRAGAKQRGYDGSEAVWESHGALITALRSAGRDDLADALHETRTALAAEHNSYPGSGRGSPGPDAPSPRDSARGDTVSRNSGEEPVQSRQPQQKGKAAEGEADSGFPHEGAAASSASPRNTPASLAVPVNKLVGRNVDWDAVAKAMEDLISTLSDPADAAPNGRFMRDNAETLNGMRVANRAAWSTVNYRLGDRYRELSGK